MEIQKWASRARGLLVEMADHLEGGMFQCAVDRARELVTEEIEQPRTTNFRAGALRAALDEIAANTRDGWARSRARTALAADDDARNENAEP